MSSNRKDEDKEIREQLKWIARISNLHRGPKSMATLNVFEQELDQAQFSSLLRPLLSKFIHLATRGTTEQLNKKKSLRRYYGKLYFTGLKPPSSAAPDTIAAGLYKRKHTVRVNNDAKIFLPENYKSGQERTVIETAFHEITHYILMEMNQGKNSIPRPEKAWQQLAENIQKEFSEKRRWGSISTRAHKFKNKGFYRENWIKELPAKLTEFVLKHQRLPSTADGFSRKTANQMKELYGNFINTIQINLNEEKEKNNKNPIYLFKLVVGLDTNASEEEVKTVVSQLPDFITLQHMGIYPLHIAANTGNIALLDALLKKENVDIDQKDKMNLTALQRAVKSGQMQAANYLSENKSTKTTSDAQEIFTESELEKKEFKESKQVTHPKLDPPEKQPEIQDISSPVFQQAEHTKKSKTFISEELPPLTTKIPTDEKKPLSRLEQVKPEKDSILTPIYENIMRLLTSSNTRKGFFHSYDLNTRKTFEAEFLIQVLEVIKDHKITKPTPKQISEAVVKVAKQSKNTDKMYNFEKLFHEHGNKTKKLFHKIYGNTGDKYIDKIMSPKKYIQQTKHFLSSKKKM